MALGSLIRRLALVESKIGTEAGWQPYDSDARAATMDATLRSMGISTDAHEAATKGYESVAAEMAASLGYEGTDGFRAFEEECRQAAAEYEGSHEWRWVPGPDGKVRCQIRDR